MDERWRAEKKIIIRCHLSMWLLFFCGVWQRRSASVKYHIQAILNECEYTIHHKMMHTPSTRPLSIIAIINNDLRTCNNMV